MASTLVHAQQNEHGRREAAADDEEDRGCGLHVLRSESRHRAESIKHRITEEQEKTLPATLR